jgi:NAD(P)-dependent dehydrogenase (short-subunit alcohol dehydrogenase family)
MKLGLDDRAIIVTGAASGIGAAIARLLAAEGAGALVLTDRDEAGLGRIADSLARDTHLHPVVADLSDPAAPAAVAGAARAAFGRIDGLVNAAGLTTRAALTSGGLEDWDRLFAVNTRAAFFLMQAAVNDMRARGSPGAIVNVLSINAHCGTPELAIYAGTKGALATLTRNAAHAHMADRIRVNGINLGWVATETEHRIQSEVLGHGPGWLERAAAAQPLGRLVTPEECARLAAFLLSDVSVPLTGALIDLEQKVLGAPAG